MATEIFEHILNKALNNRMVDPSIIFIDGTHIKASANKKKFQKEMVAKKAGRFSRIYRHSGDDVYGMFIKQAMMRYGVDMSWVLGAHRVGSLAIFLVNVISDTFDILRSVLWGGRLSEGHRHLSRACQEIQPDEK